MKQVLFSLSAICLGILAGGSQLAQLDAQDSKKADLPSEFKKEIKPILIQFCADCHAPGSGDGLHFLDADSFTDLQKMRDMYASVVEQMETNAMPPKSEDQPTAAQRGLVITWLKKTLALKPSDTDRISQYVVEVFQDSRGNLWFGTMNDGVARFDGKALTYFTKKNGLPDNTVSSVAEDKEGRLWFGTHQGICRFDGKSFKPVGSDEGIPRPKTESPMAWGGVSADRKGNIWTRVGRRVFRFNGRSFVEFKLPIDVRRASSYAIVAGSASFSLEDSKGNLWFATDGFGAYKFDGKSFTQFTKRDGLSSNNVNRIVEDDQGNLWFGCMQSFQPKMTGDGGVSRFDGKSFTRFPKVKGLSNNDIYTIYKTKNGDIWIGATGVGAYRYDGKSFQLFNKTDRRHWTRHFGVQRMLEDRNGTLWFGFSGGLFRFNGKSFFNVTKQGPWKK